MDRSRGNYCVGPILAWFKSSQFLLCVGLLKFRKEKKVSTPKWDFHIWMSIFLLFSFIELTFTLVQDLQHWMVRRRGEHFCELRVTLYCTLAWNALTQYATMHGHPFFGASMLFLSSRLLYLLWHFLPYGFSCSSPLYPKQGEQPRLSFIVVGSRSLVGQGTQAYSVLL
jgi:hypothetical protein